MRQSLIKGLQSIPKHIPLWYRYDKQGSKYFDVCCKENKFYYFYPSEISVIKQHVKVRQSLQFSFINAALTYNTEYSLRMLKFENRAEITEYDANGRGGACRKICICEHLKNACRSLQIS